MQKVCFVEDGWNFCDVDKVLFVYLFDIQWCNCVEFINGWEEVWQFLVCKWNKEFEYCLIKEFWVFIENCIVVCYVYEWYDDFGNWFCFYGNENWEFGEDGLMQCCFLCINDMLIKESDCKFYWLLGCCLDDYLGLLELGM